jgi:hypothetical protein
LLWISALTARKACDTGSSASPIPPNNATQAARPQTKTRAAARPMVRP